MLVFDSKSSYLTVFFVIHIITTSFSDEQITNLIDDNIENISQKELNIINIINDEVVPVGRQDFHKNSYRHKKKDQVENENYSGDSENIFNVNNDVENTESQKENNIINTVNNGEVVTDGVQKFYQNSYSHKRISEVENIKHLDDSETVNVNNNIGSAKLIHNVDIIDNVNNNVENVKLLDSLDIININDDKVKNAKSFNVLKESENTDNETLNSEKTYPKEIATLETSHTNSTISDKSTNVTKYICTQDIEHGPVELVNATKLSDIIKEFTTVKSRNGKNKEGPCVLIMFYATWCIFSSQAAPHFNALPKFFPHIKFVAIDAMKYQYFNSHYGIVGVPTLMLIHDGKPAAKFNDTVYSLETFAKFITHLTTLQPNRSLHVTSADFSGPVSSVPVTETDYCLILSWTFIAICAMYFTSQSQWWRQFVESVQNTWRESNAQHEHID